DAAGGLVRNRRSEAALSELAQVCDLLVAHGIREVVNLDLGAIRDFDYYTGVIFEGYGPDFGRPVAQGGRYDALLARFGRPAPAGRRTWCIALARRRSRGRRKANGRDGFHPSRWRRAWQEASSDTWREGLHRDPDGRAPRRSPLAARALSTCSAQRGRDRPPAPCRA